MENKFKTINLNKRVITIVVAAICALLILFLIIPWYHVSDYDYSHGLPPTHISYYSSPLSITLGLGLPPALVALVALITDMVCLFSDFFVIDLKHRRMIRIGSLILFAASVLLVIAAFLAMFLGATNKQVAI